MGQRVHAPEEAGTSRLQALLADVDQEPRHGRRYAALRQRKADDPVQRAVLAVLQAQFEARRTLRVRPCRLKQRRGHLAGGFERIRREVPEQLGGDVVGREDVAFERRRHVTDGRHLVEQPARLGVEGIGHPTARERVEAPRASARAALVMWVSAAGRRSRRAGRCAGQHVDVEVGTAVGAG